MDEKKDLQISVIIPVYNVSDYIGKSLDCLINQKFRNFEIICIDDCSSDGTAQILKQYEEKFDYIHVYTNAVNMGAAESRNRGLQYARGKYVIFLDSDDIFHDQLLGKLYFACEKDHSEAAFCKCKSIDEEKRVKGFIHLPKDAECINSFNRNLLFQRLCFVPWNKLVLKELLLREDISFQNIPNANDVYYSLMVMTLAKRISLVNEELLLYMENRSGSLSLYRDKKKTYVVYALEKYLRTLNERNLITNENRGYIVGSLITEVYKTCMYLKGKMSEQVRADFVEKILPMLDEMCKKSVLQLSIWEWYQLDFLRGEIKKEKSRYQVYASERKMNNKKIAIWGAGKLGTRFLQELEHSEQRIDYVIDNDRTKWGMNLYGYEVTGFDKVKSDVDEIWVLNPQFLCSIQNQVQNICEVVDVEGILKKRVKRRLIINPGRIIDEDYVFFG